MLECAAKLFPRFAKMARKSNVAEILPPASYEQLSALESNLGCLLPETYKALLRCARGFWLSGGSIQFGPQHPFFHKFKPFDKLTAQQQQMVSLKGGKWPPPTQGMLCFAEFFMEADGDQVLFDVAGGLIQISLNLLRP